MNERTRLSRRQFAALVAGGAVAGATAFPAAASPAMQTGGAVTAQDVLERIMKGLGVAWQAETVDGFKAGDPTAVVKGIATTSMATLAVLRSAQAAGANLVLTAEPTFYSRGDARTPPAGRGRGGRAGGPPPPPPVLAPSDPIFTAKNDFIDRHGMVVLRLNDHWKRRQPNPFAQGLAGALGWTGRQQGADVARYEIPGATLEALARHVQGALGSRGGMRVVGDHQTRVRRVALLPGSTPIAASLELMPAVDVIIAGEVREWESVEYARDLAHAGKGKGLILVGRVVSEEPGMNACADWLGRLVPEVQARHITAGDPCWRPA